MARKVPIFSHNCGVGGCDSDQDGVVEGEQNRSVEIAQNMKQLGLSKDLIAQATGLAEVEIDQIQPKE